MANKSKKQSQRSLATIDLGKSRKQQIADFRAKRHLAKAPIATIEQAVNILVDRGLEAEGIPA